MRTGVRCIAAIGLGLFVVIGCGGGGGAAGSAAAPTPAATASVGAASAGAATPEAPSGGGGTAVGVCELVTPDELAKIFGVPSVTPTVLEGPPDTCVVDSNDGAPLAAWVLTLANSKTLFDTFAGDPASIAVPGIGDKAAFVQNTGLLVLKGDALVTISLSTGVEDLSEEAQDELAKQIGAIAAGRM